MKRLWLCCLLVALGMFGLAAQDYTITKTVFMPSIYYVGDKVEIRVSLRSAFAHKMSVPAKIPQPVWGKLLSAVLINRENEPELRLVFISYAAGTRPLPALNLGPVVLEGINVYVTSTLGAGAVPPNLAPPREQLPLPGSYLLIIVQIVVFVLTPIGLFLVFTWIKPVLRRWFRRRREGAPYRRIQKSLRGLAGGLERMDARSFYIRIMDDTRLYLNDRMGLSAMAATTAELEQALLARVHHTVTAQQLLHLFRQGDRVKFAGVNASLQTCLIDLQNLEEALRHIEQEERFRHQAETTLEAVHADL